MGKGAIFKEICTTYTEYVTGKYGNAIVVFDGYQSKSTKDKTRNLHREHAPYHDQGSVFCKQGK